MQAMQQYILSVITMAVVCALVKSVCVTSGHRKVIDLLCGLVLSIIVLNPFKKLDFEYFYSEIIEYALADGTEALYAGMEFRRETMASIIKSRTEAYILDKAAQWNASAKISVSLQDGEIPVPVSVKIQGAFSPYARQQLTKLLEQELGIAKENQQWTG